MAQPLKDTDAILTNVDDLRAKDAEIAALKAENKRLKAEIAGNNSQFDEGALLMDAAVVKIEELQAERDDLLQKLQAANKELDNLRLRGYGQ